MGTHANIKASTFPQQGSHLNRRVKVCFHYDTTTPLFGTVVRDDTESPFRTIIRLDDGRHVLTVECQYSPYDGVEDTPENHAEKLQLATYPKS